MIQDILSVVDGYLVRQEFTALRQFLSDIDIQSVIDEAAQENLVLPSILDGHLGWLVENTEFLKDNIKSGGEITPREFNRRVEELLCLQEVLRIFSVILEPDGQAVYGYSLGIISDFLEIIRQVMIGRYSEVPTLGWKSRYTRQDEELPF